jgi:hypothetical protein
MDRAVETQGAVEERFLSVLSSSDGKKLNDLLRTLLLEIEDRTELRKETAVRT